MTIVKSIKFPFSGLQALAVARRNNIVSQMLFFYMLIFNLIYKKLNPSYRTMLLEQVDILNPLSGAPYTEVNVSSNFPGKANENAQIIGVHLLRMGASGYVML